MEKSPKLEKWLVKKFIWGKSQYDRAPYTFTLLSTLTVVLIIFLMPLIFTGYWGFVHFGKASEVGDTIGGITAPFINIIAGLLVYYSFREQQKANTILSEQYMADKLTREINEICDDINNQLKYFEPNFTANNPIARKEADWAMHKHIHLWRQSLQQSSNIAVYNYPHLADYTYRITMIFKTILSLYLFIEQNINNKLLQFKIINALDKYYFEAAGSQIPKLHDNELEPNDRRLYDIEDVYQAWTNISDLYHRAPWKTK